MNLRDLKYLVAVADHKHFGKAADACFVSQPTLSMQIKKLEEFLDVKLIERNNKKLLITPIGEEIVARARVILDDAEQIRDLARQSSDPMTGRLRLGVIPTIAPYLLPLILPKIHLAYPELEIHLQEAQTHVITDQLLTGKLDAIILALPVEYDSVATHALYHEPFYVGVPDSHPYADRKSLKHDDLVSQPILLLEDGHCLRDQALDVCQTAGAHEKTEFRATSLETLRYMVASESGITLMPKLAIRENDGVAYIPFRNPAPTRAVGLAWRNTSPRKALMDALSDKIRAIMKTHGLR